MNLEDIMKAIWENTILAESERTVVIEGNHYFPPDSVRKEYFLPSDKHTACAWKGTASYYHICVGGRTNADAAWYYPEPKKAVHSIRDYVAFWRGVQILS
jgi:uncharacterized protein (DUF427 family)